MRNNILILAILLFSLGLWHPVQATGAGTVMILNSDSKVNFYSSSENSFRTNFPGKVHTIDLGDKKWSSLNKIKSKLHDIYPEVVYCIGTRAYLVADKFIPERNIVFSSAINHTNLPLNHNAYGITSRLHSGMEMMTLKNIFPELNKIGVIYTDMYHKDWIETTGEDADKMGISLTKIKCDSVNGVTVAHLEKLKNLDALWLTPDPGAYHDYKSLKMVLDFCLENSIPVLSYSPKMLIHESVVISVSVDTATIGRQASIVVQRLLEGDKPGSKVFYPAGTVIKVNRRRAKKFGLKFDNNALSTVNEIID